MHDHRAKAAARRQAALARLMSGTAFIGAGICALIAVVFLGLGSTNGPLGALGGLVYAVILGWPGLPLFLLGRRARRRARSLAPA